MSYQPTDRIPDSVSDLPSLRSYINGLMRRVLNRSIDRISTANRSPLPQSGDARFDDKTGALSIYSVTLGGWTTHSKD